MRECLTKLRQTCCHPDVVLRAGELKGNSGMRLSNIVNKFAEKGYSVYEHVRFHKISCTNRCAIKPCHCELFCVLHECAELPVRTPSSFCSFPDV